MYIMKNQEETNMKESNLIEKVEVLCKELTESLHAAYKHTANDYYDYSVGKKYIKIISNGNQTSVWGFINIGEFVKERKMTNEIKKVTFKEGDVLMSAGWNTPALNAPRGNLLEGYSAQGQQNMYGPSYLI
tara:strand:+ start:312 stop:704 length:393 start_codon:yes stop_codon:yes gene_type:complete